MKAIREDVLIDTIHDIDPNFPIDKLAEKLRGRCGYVLFKCDREQCPDWSKGPYCSDDFCYSTTDIEHAVDFEIIALNGSPNIVIQKNIEKTKEKRKWHQK